MFSSNLCFHWICVFIEYVFLPQRMLAPDQMAPRNLWRVLLSEQLNMSPSISFKLFNFVLYHLNLFYLDFIQIVTLCAHLSWVGGVEVFAIMGPASIFQLVPVCKLSNVPEVMMMKNLKAEAILAKGCLAMSRAGSGEAACSSHWSRPARSQTCKGSGIKILSSCYLVNLSSCQLVILSSVILSSVMSCSKEQPPTEDSYFCVAHLFLYERQSWTRGSFSRRQEG